MKNLDEETEAKVQDAFSVACDLFNEYKTIECIEKCKEGIQMLPGDATEFDMGYTFVSTICENAFHDELFDLVEEWLPLYLVCDEKLRGFGNSELLAGRMEMRNGDKKKAMEFFVLANKLSSGRIWSGKKDSEAYHFYKENK